MKKILGAIGEVLFWLALWLLLSTVFTLALIGALYLIAG